MKPISYLSTSPILLSPALNPSIMVYNCNLNTRQTSDITTHLTSCLSAALNRFINSPVCLFVPYTPDQMEPPFVTAPPDTHFRWNRSIRIVDRWHTGHTSTIDSRSTIHHHTLNRGTTRYLLSTVYWLANAMSGQFPRVDITHQMWALLTVSPALIQPRRGLGEWWQLLLLPSPSSTIQHQSLQLC